ncbi:LCI fold-containing protein [Paenibacillus chitinolyticus]|uniref:LCI fold-containing protein n=1 Tax=Paenibacillus chitinolyticus TaxID=79263 RepID=UPI00364ECB8F
MMKKILINSALSLSLLFSAAPAFAAVDTSTPTTCKDTIQDRYIKNRTGIFSDHFTENGTTWYIKGITSERVSNDGGYVLYTAHYQAHVCG